MVLADINDGSREAIARAIANLTRLARDGEARANQYLAAFAAAGVGMAQSWPLALDLLANAAVEGSEDARGQLRALAGLGDEAPEADWATLRKTVRIEEWTTKCEKRVLNAAPRVVTIDAFLSPAVCAWLIRRATGRMAPARVYSLTGDQPGVSAARRNSAFEFTFIDCDVVAHMVRARIAATIGVPIAALESSQILHYDVGEAFATHHDYLYTSDPGQAAEIAAHGQRMATFLIYLNADFHGGETDFPRLGLRHRGGVGGALYFANLGLDGQGDPRTLHAGLAPTRGEKWLFSQWVRNRAVM